MGCFILLGDMVKMDYLHTIKNKVLKGLAGTPQEKHQALVEILSFINHEESDYVLRLQYYEEMFKRS